MSSPARCLTAPAIVRSTAPRGLVEVELAAPPACRGCEGACLWRRLPASTRARFATDLPLEVGDSVLICLPPRHVLLGAALLHGLPWAGLVGGALAGFAASGSDFGSLVGAVAGVSLVLAAATPLRARIERWTLGRIVIERVLE